MISSLLKCSLPLVTILLAGIALPVRAGAPQQDGRSGRRIVLPQPPEGLSPGQALGYMASRYWDGMDFRDEGWLADSTALEQAFATWAYLLGRLPQDEAVPLVGKLLQEASARQEMLLRMAELAEHYFDDPNSPYRSEEFHIAALEALLAAPGLDDIHKIRPRELLADARRNRPGMRAAELRGTDAAGREAKLSDVEAEFTLLLFYEPGCPECARTERLIAASDVFGSLLRAGRLAVVAFSPDTELARWREQLPELPAPWLVLCDPQQRVRRSRSYVIRATPTLYLLDGDKRVLLKDTPVEEMERWLTQRLQTDTK